MTTSSDEDVVKKSGTLGKQYEDKWKKRFIKVTDSSLIVFKNEKTEAPAELELKLAELKDVQDSQPQTNLPNTFAVSLQDGTIHHFAATSVVEMDEWIIMFKSLVDPQQQQHATTEPTTTEHQQQGDEQDTSLASLKLVAQAASLRRHNKSPPSPVESKAKSLAEYAPQAEQFVEKLATSVFASSDFSSESVLSKLEEHFATYVTARNEQVKQLIESKSAPSLLSYLLLDYLFQFVPQEQERLEKLSQEKKQKQQESSEQQQEEKQPATVTPRSTTNTPATPSAEKEPTPIPVNLDDLTKGREKLDVITRAKKPTKGNAKKKPAASSSAMAALQKVEEQAKKETLTQVSHIADTPVVVAPSPSVEEEASKPKKIPMGVPMMGIPMGGIPMGGFPLRKSTNLSEPTKTNDATTTTTSNEPKQPPFGLRKSVNYEANASDKPPAAAAVPFGLKPVLPGLKEGIQLPLKKPNTEDSPKPDDKPADKPKKMFALPPKPKEAEQQQQQPTTPQDAPATTPVQQQEAPKEQQPVKKFPPIPASKPPALPVKPPVPENKPVDEHQQPATQEKKIPPLPTNKPPALPVSKPPSLETKPLVEEVSEVPKDKPKPPIPTNKPPILPKPETTTTVEHPATTSEEAAIEKVRKPSVMMMGKPLLPPMLSGEKFPALRKTSAAQQPEEKPAESPTTNKPAVPSNKPPPLPATKPPSVVAPDTTTPVTPPPPQVVAPNPEEKTPEKAAEESKPKFKPPMPSDKPAMALPTGDFRAVLNKRGSAALQTNEEKKQDAAQVDFRNVLKKK